MSDEPMSTTVEQTQATLSELVALRATTQGDALSAQQAAAAAAVERNGFPTTEHEEWRYTNVAPIVRAQYRTASTAAALELHGEEIHPDLPEAINIIVLNGRVALKQSLALPEGLTIEWGEKARSNAALASRIGTLARSSEHPFAALNLALLDEIVLVHLAAGTRLETPVELLHVVQGATEPVATNVRLVIIAERASQLTVVESYRGNGRYLSNVVTELFAGDGAIVDHYKIECESESAWHIGNMQAHLERSASARFNVVSFGGDIVRNELAVKLDGEGAEALLRGLYVLRGTQRVDNHTVIEHARPHTTSLELYKGILDGKSHGSFDGKIIVAKDAQKTSSKQTNNNLLLSRDAVADSKPQLEIYADDVKCAHGSTIGQLDEEAIFYLRSRGIDEAQARSVLAFAFASELLETIRIPSLRESLTRQLLERIPRAEEVSA
jgi:Fe-S cluster assembly protein SufD